MSTTSSTASSSAQPSRRERREQAHAYLTRLVGETFPNSDRIYLQGSSEDIRVPMRRIHLAPTLIGGSKEAPQYEPNEPCWSMILPEPMGIRR